MREPAANIIPIPTLRESTFFWLLTLFVRTKQASKKKNIIAQSYMVGAYVRIFITVFEPLLMLYGGGAFPNHVLCLTFSL